MIKIFKRVVLPKLKELVFIAILALVIRLSIFTIYLVPTGSMLPTIFLGDRLFVNRLAYGLILPFTNKQIIAWDSPQRGDIISFLNPLNGDTYIKRVIGLPGDVIAFVHGVLVINGISVREDIVVDGDLIIKSGLYRADIFAERFAPSSQSFHYIARVPYSEAQRRYNNLQASRILPQDTLHYVLPTYFDTRIFTVPEHKLLMIGDNRDNSLDGRFWGFIEEKNVYGKALFRINRPFKTPSLY